VHATSLLQVAGFTTLRDYDSVFTVVTPDPAHRIASDGIDVLAGVPICLKHCATNALLCLEGTSYPNEFGTEREVSFKTMHSNGKKLLLVHERNGELTSTLPGKQPAANQFRFVVGSTVDQLPVLECVPRHFVVHFAACRGAARLFICANSQERRRWRTHAACMNAMLIRRRRPPRTATIAAT
jgi:hypothetical protein